MNDLLGWSGGGVLDPSSCFVPPSCWHVFPTFTVLFFDGFPYAKLLMNMKKEKLKPLTYRAAQFAPAIKNMILRGASHLAPPGRVKTKTYQIYIYISDR